MYTRLPWSCALLVDVQAHDGYISSHQHANNFQIMDRAFEAVQLLLERGADVFAQTENGAVVAPSIADKQVLQQ